MKHSETMPVDEFMRRTIDGERNLNDYLHQPGKHSFASGRSWGDFIKSHSPVNRVPGQSSD